MATRFAGGAEPCSVASVTGVGRRGGGGVGAVAGAGGGPAAWVDAGAAGASSGTALRDQLAPILRELHGRQPASSHVICGKATDGTRDQS
jgi:hypothetical protein